jgi:hypothetical protein
VDKITWGSFSFLFFNIFLKKGADSLFGGIEGRGALYSTGVENTAIGTAKVNANWHPRYLDDKSITINNCAII